MFNIYVERVINKDINTVFEILSDHEGASQYRGVKNAKLLAVSYTHLTLPTIYSV